MWTVCAVKIRKAMIWQKETMLFKNGYCSYCKVSCYLACETGTFCEQELFALYLRSQIFFLNPGTPLLPGLHVPKELQYNIKSNKKPKYQYVIPELLQWLLMSKNFWGRPCQQGQLSVVVVGDNMENDMMRKLQKPGVKINR